MTLKKPLVSVLVGAGIVLSNTAYGQAFFNCDLLVGKWEGEHTYANGSYNFWRAEYFADGSLQIAFYNETGDHLGDQTGSWQCDSVHVKSTMVEQGQEYDFEYRIRQLDETSYVYESVLGPVFTSSRVD